MYPFLRYSATIVKAALQVKKGHTLSFDDVSEMSFRCRLTDIDNFLEMNNGRVLTLNDMGRMDFAVRTGLVSQLIKQRWGLVVAGSTIQYRKRIRVFDKVTIKTHVVGLDTRWIYIEQSMWVKGKPCSSALLRTGVTERGKVIEPKRVMVALGIADWVKPPEPWVQDWIEGDKEHRWPPMG